MSLCWVSVENMLDDIWKCPTLKEHWRKSQKGISKRTGREDVCIFSLRGPLNIFYNTVRHYTLCYSWDRVNHTLCGSELYLIQSQHVEVTDVVLLGVSDPGPALLLINHLSHVLAHKLALGRKTNYFTSSCASVVPVHWREPRCYLLDVMDAAKSPAPRQRPEDLHLAVLTLGECLVEAALARRANLRVHGVTF